MFKHILIPTDGSELANKAVTEGVQFAKEIHARITGLTVTPPFHYFGLDASQIRATVNEYEDHASAQAQRALTSLQEAARAAGVECQTLHRSSEHPYEEIVKTAEQQGCDVIFQASHGRRGMKALLLGSETNKVLTHSKIPVLVFR